MKIVHLGYKITLLNLDKLLYLNLKTRPTNVLQTKWREVKDELQSQ